MFEQRISISAVRQIGRDTPSLEHLLLALIDAAETLRQIHEIECGCDRPGSPTVCAWPLADGELLARFDFDEETERR